MAKDNPSQSKKPRFEHTVCKPCWELKYCPYGPLVEFYPLVSDIPIAEIRKSYRSWINAVREGSLKSRKEIYQAIEKILCLEPKRWEWIHQYRTDELRCSVFGHVCPVFLSAEPFTETREERRTGRSIPRDIMLQVVRRDGQICRDCRKNVPDDEIEFDHIIPISRGGPTSVENLRLVCKGCNRKKGDSLDALIDDSGPFGSKA